MSSQVFVPLDDPHGVTGPSLSGHWAALEGGNYFGGQSIYVSFICQLERFNTTRNSLPMALVSPLLFKA